MANTFATTLTSSTAKLNQAGEVIVWDLDGQMVMNNGTSDVHTMTFSYRIPFHCDTVGMEMFNLSSVEYWTDQDKLDLIWLYNWTLSDICTAQYQALTAPAP